MRYVDGPSKYEGEPIWVEVLHQLALEGWYDDETGNVSEVGFIANLFRFDEETFDVLRRRGLTEDEIQELRQYAGAIIEEDDLGFVTGEAYQTVKDLEDAWEFLQTEIEVLGGVE